MALKRPREVEWNWRQPSKKVFPSCPGANGCFLSPSGGGKTTTLISMLLGPYAKVFDEVHIFSPSVDIDSAWDVVREFAKGLKAASFHSEWDEPALLEILAFGLFLLGVMVFGAVHFDGLLGAATAARATSAVALVALGSLVAAVGAVVIAKGLGQAPAAPGVGPLAGLRAALRAAGEHLRHSGLALTNLGLAGGQVLSLVVIFWCLLPASGATPELPLLAVSGILAVGSLASIALPPSLGAAPAAVSVFVLGFFGVGEAQALTYAALTWVVNVVPALVLGAVPLWRRIGLLGELRGGDDRAPASER